MVSDLEHTVGTAEETSPLTFSLLQWCYWQIEPLACRHYWPCGQILPSGATGIELQHLAMMQRRRLSPLGKAACAVAWECQQTYGNLPTVFYSAHGESRYYFEMLQDMAANEPVSPTRFSLCVHNAIAGLFSIQTQNVLPYVALAGGTEGIAAAFIEASGLLLEVPKVLLVCYEQALPAEYQRYLPAREQTWALALVLGRAANPAEWHLQWQRKAGLQKLKENSAPTVFPQAIVTGQFNGCLQQPTSTWHWTLHHD